MGLQTLSSLPLVSLSQSVLACICNAAKGVSLSLLLNLCEAELLQNFMRTQHNNQFQGGSKTLDVMKGAGQNISSV